MTDTTHPVLDLKLEHGNDAGADTVSNLIEGAIRDMCGVK